MKRKVSPLPDLDDDEFTRRLKPLEAMMLLNSKGTADQNSIDPGVRQTEDPAVGLTGYPADRIESTLTPHNFTLSTTQVEQPQDIRNPGVPESRSTDSPNESALGSREVRNTERPGGRIIGNSAVQTDMQIRDNSGVRADSSENPRERWTGVVGAAERLVRIEQTRGPKRRFEYLIPQRVGDALAQDAVRKGKSATVLLLEVLRDAGYPVIPEDLIDLRKERRR
jgi:hypothetical protein